MTAEEMKAKIVAYIRERAKTYSEDSKILGNDSEYCFAASLSLRLTADRIERDINAD